MYFHWLWNLEIWHNCMYLLCWRHMDLNWWNLLTLQKTSQWINHSIFLKLRKTWTEVFHSLYCRAWSASHQPLPLPRFASVPCQHWRKVFSFSVHAIPLSMTILSVHRLLWKWLQGKLGTCWFFICFVSWNAPEQQSTINIWQNHLSFFLTPFQQGDWKKI